MTIIKAYEILGCRMEDSKQEIKRKYKRLLHITHPDSKTEGAYKYTIQEIIDAYRLIEEAPQREVYKENQKRRKEKTKNWDAPINERAYTERKIYQNVEDYDGEIIGTIDVSTGKYMWKPEEDFTLFLKSIYECSKELLVSFDDEQKLLIQPQLAFLLSSQFIDGMEFLNTFAKKEDEEVYYVNAMLELTIANASKVKAGMKVYPRRIKEHKLFIQNHQGEELGYLSFKDDRLYYCIIPLFEEKRAMVKLQIASKQDRLNTRNINKYKNLDLWIKLTQVDSKEIMMDINSQIDNLLKGK